MRVLVIAILAVLVATSPAAAFERVGDRKILVFAGRQEVPTIDPSIKYDWSIRMAQQSLYDALVKYVGNRPRSCRGSSRNGRARRTPRCGRSTWRRTRSFTTASR